MFSKRISPDEDALFHVEAGSDKDGFKVKHINDDIGKGVFTTKKFPHGSFLLEYRGERIAHSEALKRMVKYKEGNTFMYFFSHKGITECIDATKFQSVARFVNDGTGSGANCTMKKRMFNGEAYLCLYALREIKDGEELRYDYGQPNLPWRAKSKRNMQKVAAKSNVQTSSNVEGPSHSSSGRDVGRNGDSAIRGTVSPGKGQRTPSSTNSDDEGTDIDVGVKLRQSTRKGKKRPSSSNSDDEGTDVDVGVKLRQSTRKGKKRSKKSKMGSKKGGKGQSSKRKRSPSSSDDEGTDIDVGVKLRQSTRKGKKRSKKRKVVPKKMGKRQISKVKGQISKGKGQTSKGKGQTSKGKRKPSSTDSDDEGTDVDVGVTLRQSTRKGNQKKSKSRVPLSMDSDSDVVPPSPLQAKKRRMPSSSNSDDEGTDIDVGVKLRQSTRKGKKRSKKSKMGSKKGGKGQSSKRKRSPSSTDSDDEGTDVDVGVKLRQSTRKGKKRSKKSKMGSEKGGKGQSSKRKRSPSSSDDEGTDIDVGVKLRQSTRKGKKRVASSCVTSSSGEDTGSSGEYGEIFVRKISDGPKRNACLYCDTLQTKVSKHYMRSHPDEQEVAKILAIKKNSKERSNLMELLLHRGNYTHNRLVLGEGKGEIIPVRRPIASTPYEDYGPCPTCFGFFTSDDIRRHSAYRCVGATEEASNVHSRVVRMESSILLGSAVSELRNVLPVISSMRQDDITMVAKHDTLILNLGDNLAQRCIKMDPQKKRHYVAQKMRESSRLLLKFRSISVADASMDEMLKPKYYKDVIQAVKETGGSVTNEDCDGLKHPSTVLKLSHDLQKLAKIKRALAIIAGDSEKKEQADNFMQLMASDFGDKITVPALSTLAQRRYEQEEELPQSEDIFKFSNFLTQEIKKASKDLRGLKEVEERSRLYRRALSLVLAKLTFFNKRRPGETEQLSLSAYTSSSNKDVEDILNTLTPMEKELCKMLRVVFIRGKRGRKVPLIIPNDCGKLMDRLKDLRQSAGVARKNNYFFGRFGALTPIRATDTIRELTQEAGLQSPHLLRLTKLRKYCATLSQVFSLNETNTEWLAEHLGHSVRVHKEHYRLPSSLLEKAKVAKLLMAIDAGMASTFAGKSLDEISFDEIPIDLEDQYSFGQSNPSTSNPSTSGPSTSGPSTSGPSTSGPSTSGPSTSGPSTSGPSTSGPSTSGPSTSGLQAQKEIAKTSGRVRQWPDKEKSILISQFKKHLKKGTLPGKSEIESVMEKFPSNFRGRTWRNIKDCVRNISTNLKLPTQNVAGF